MIAFLIFDNLRNFDFIISGFYFDHDYVLDPLSYNDINGLVMLGEYCDYINTKDDSVYANEYLKTIYNYFREDWFVLLSGGMTSNGVLKE